MTNRIRELLEEPEERPPEQDHWVLYGTFGIYYVAPEEAAAIDARLVRRWPGRWLTFRDLTGSRVRVRSSAVESLCECTAAQRERGRSISRMLRSEERADRRPWEED